MRIACIVGTLLGAGGCAQLVGAEDPVAAFEVSDRIDGTFVLGLDAESSTVTLGVYRFLVEVEVDPDDRTATMFWSALEHTGPEIAAEDVLQFDAELANQRELDFLFSVTLDIPATATAEGIDHRLIGTFDGIFPALDGTTATTDAFCGTGDGTVSLPSDGTFVASYTAVRIETGSIPPEPGEVKTDCSDL